MSTNLYALKGASCASRCLRIPSPHSRCVSIRIAPVRSPLRIAFQRCPASTAAAKAAPHRGKGQPLQSQHSPPDPAKKPSEPRGNTAPKTAKAAHVAKARGNVQQDGLIYPDVLMVFRASRPKIYFAAFLKLVGLALSLVGLNYGVVLYFDPSGESWRAVLIAACFSVPLAYTVFYVNPFITSVHLHLPRLARTAVPKLEMYINNLPSTAKVDITSLRWMLPETSRVKVSDLSVVGDPLGSLVLRRWVPEDILQSLKWYQRRPIRSFMMDEKSSGPLPVPGVWEAMLPRIVKGWQTHVEKTASKPTQR